MSFSRFACSNWEIPGTIADCERVWQLFPWQKRDRVALLAIIRCCRTWCWDRSPLLWDGEVAAESVVESEIGAGWVVSGEAVPEIPHHLGACLSGCSTPYLQRLNPLTADTNGSASRSKFCQEISSWPVVSSSKWRVGTVTEVVPGVCHWTNAAVEHGRWLSKMNNIDGKMQNIIWIFLTSHFYWTVVSFFFFSLFKTKILDIEREIHAAPHVSEKLIQLFRNKSEFTFLATLQQKASTSGVILSIRELEHR